MSVFHNNVLAGAAGQTGGDAAAAGPIKSLRFNSGDSAYLNRTPSSAGNQTTWTWSCWLKRSNLGDDAFIGENGGYPNASAFFQSDGKIRFTAADASSAVFLNLVTSQLFRDVSAWYHIVCVLDTTNSTTADRARIYVNGTRVTDFSTATYPSQNATTIFNASGNEMRIGQHSGVSYFDGYMADIYFVDGSALDATSFGAFDSNGVWQAAAYSGTYGTNGFHLLDFANESTIGHDSSGNNNDFTANNLSDVDGIVESTSNFSGSGTTYGNLSVILDNDTTTGYSVQAGTLTYTPASAISVSSQIKFWYSTDQSNTRFRVNNGSWITLSDPNGVGTYTHSFSGSLTKIEWNAPSSSELVGVHQIEIDSKTLVSSSVLAGNDVLFDVPTNGTQSDTGAGGEVSGNYAVLNALNTGSNITLKQGNLGLTASSHSTSLSTVAVAAGMKTYMETTVVTDGVNGWGLTINPQAESGYSTTSGKWWVYDNGVNFSIQNQGTSTPYGVRVNAGDILQLAVDYDAGKAFVGINNTWINSTNGTNGNPSTGANPTFTFSTTDPIFPLIHLHSGELAVNFGQRAWAYSAPSNYVALNTAALPTPTIADGRDYFDAKLWTGNSTDQRAITGYQFSPDLVYIKRRNATYGGIMMDTVRGLNSGHAGTLYTNATNSEDTGATSSIRSFNSDGFNLGTDGGINYSGSTYVGWAWDAGTSTDTNNTSGSITPSGVRANQSAGFSIVKYTGTSASTNTIGHGLNAAPEFIIVKSTSASDGWFCYHAGIDTTSPEDYDITLNTTGARRDYQTWNDTKPTSSVFSVGNTGASNENGREYIAYCFAPVSGFSMFGSFEGNSGQNFQYTGFQPRWIMIKTTSITAYPAYTGWAIFDTVREPNNVNVNSLFANNSNTEGKRGNNSTASAPDFGIDILSNGFCLRDNGASEINLNGEDYIFAAFASNPFQANGGLAR